MKYLLVVVVGLVVFVNAKIYEPVYVETAIDWNIPSFPSATEAKLKSGNYGLADITDDSSSRSASGVLKRLLEDTKNWSRPTGTHQNVNANGNAKADKLERSSVESKSDLAEMPANQENKNNHGNTESTGNLKQTDATDSEITKALEAILNFRFGVVESIQSTFYPVY